MKKGREANKQIQAEERKNTDTEKVRITVERNNGQTYNKDS